MADMPDCRRRGWGAAAWIVVVLLVLYPLSFGPALWWADRVGGGMFLVIYLPVVWGHRKVSASEPRRRSLVPRPLERSIDANKTTGIVAGMKFVWPIGFAI